MCECHRNNMCPVHFTGVAVQQACKESFDSAIARVGGNGGIIGVDKAGNVGVYFNTSGMP